MEALNRCQLKNFTYITFLTEFLPLIFCILFRKKLVTKSLKVFFIYTIALAAFVAVSLLALHVFHYRQLYLSRITRFYVVAEYILFAIFLYNIYVNPIARKVIIYSIIPFVLFSILDFVISDKSQFSKNPFLVEFMAFILFIIYFFYEKMKTVILYPLSQSITFWICVGLFLYFSGNFFYLLFSKTNSSDAFKTQMKIVYSFVTVTKNIFLSLALFASENNPAEQEELSIPNNLGLDEFTLNNSIH